MHWFYFNLVRDMLGYVPQYRAVKAVAFQRPGIREQVEYLIRADALHLIDIQPFRIGVHTFVNELMPWWAFAGEVGRATAEVEEGFTFRFRFDWCVYSISKLAD